MRLKTLLSLVLPGALAVMTAACTDDTSNTDAGTADSAIADVGPPDTGAIPDAGFPDAEEPLPCQRDQGGEANRGCEPGFVCNLKMDPPQCVQGTACTADTDCNSCSQSNNPTDCGHGYKLAAFCDANHGNVCVRSRTPCEPCETDRDCGYMDPNLGLGGPNNPNKCLEYEAGGPKFCGRPCSPLGCPDGFICDSNDNQCRRADGCAAEPVFCPAADNPGQGCPGREQICPGVECPDTGGARCTANDAPGNLGLCIGSCKQNSECPPDRPICNPDNGICVVGCTKDSCPPPKVCHVDGRCGNPCENDDDCTMNSRYGPDTYCNLPGRPPPRIYKGGYRDENSCAPLGCEQPIDCPSAGRVCDPTLAPPACVEGCYTTEDDCVSGFVCKSGPQGSYDRRGCRALPEKTDKEEIGVCCNPGCFDRNLSCNINEFCCAEPGSPYEDEGSCLNLTDTSTVMAEAGQCFQMPVRQPWCAACMSSDDCSSGWTAGFNVDPTGAINGGLPFQEQEFCFQIAMGVNQCSVTCNPEAADNACPRGWVCGPITPGCLQDADCGAAGLTCIGADTAAMPPRPGRCKCGENGMEQVQCPTAYGGPGAGLGTVENPRCLDLDKDGEMYCTAAFNCNGPAPRVDMMTGTNIYPATCGY